MKEMFNSAHGDRAGVPDVAVVVTDGKSNDRAATVSEARGAKQRGIKVIGLYHVILTTK